MPVQVAAPSFEAAAMAAMVQLQAALADLVAALPEPVRRAVDLERALRLEKKLAWQMFRLSRTADLAEAANVPSLTAAARVIDAARKRGAGEGVLDRVREAFENFENFAAVHGGDRAGLISMVSGLTGDKSEQFEINVRKGLFKGQAHVWGVQARMSVRTAIFVPRAGSNRIEDVALVAGDVGLQRRRQTDPLTMLWWLKTGGVSAMSGLANAPGEGGEIDHGLELLTDFCSKPLPQMEQKLGKGGMPETELVFPPGRAGAVSMYWRNVREAVPSPPNDSFFGRTLFTIPLETMVWEVMIPVGWSNPATARAAMYGRRHHPEQVYEERTVDLLPQRESLDYLGVHDCVPPLAGGGGGGGAPSHPDVVRQVIDDLGWRGTRFDVYRCRVEFPLMHTLLVARVDAIAR